MIASMKRVIVFVSHVQECACFYRDAFDLIMIPSDDPQGWQELDAGGCRIAFHQANCDGKASPSAEEDSMNPHKLVFYAKDVAATRAELARRGVKMGKVKTFGSLVMCDGNDPAGNRFQISNRA